MQPEGNGNVGIVFPGALPDCLHLSWSVFACGTCVCMCVEAKMEPWHCNLSLMTGCYLTLKWMHKIYTDEQLAYFSMPACLLHSNSPKDAMWALHLLCPSLIAQFECREWMQTRYSTVTYFLNDWKDWKSIYVENKTVICLFQLVLALKLGDKLKPKCEDYVCGSDKYLREKWWKQVQKMVFRCEVLLQCIWRNSKTTVKWKVLSPFPLKSKFLQSEFILLNKIIWSAPCTVVFCW